MAKSELTHRFWGLLVHITKSETLAEADRIAQGNDGVQALTAGVSGALSPRGCRSFLRRCGKTWSQAGINLRRTARLKSQRARANSTHFRYLMSVTVW